jgi:putative selenate reductase FAD-binding subunit
MIEAFLTASSLEEALRLKQKGGPKTAFLAGGTEINRLGSPLSPHTVISLDRLGLDHITKAENGLVIGARSTMQDVLDSELVPAWLKHAILFCASRTRRNMATIGGNLVVQRDDSYLTPTLVAAKARLVLASLGQDGTVLEENIPIREYLAFKEHFNDSLLLSVVLNKPSRFVASLRFAVTEQSPAAVTISLGADMSSGAAHDVRLCAAVKGTGVFRLPEQEEAISNGSYVGEDAILTFTVPAVSIVDDISGTQSYKRYLLGTALATLYRTCLDSRVQGGTV